MLMQTAKNLIEEELSYWIAFSRLPGVGIGVSKMQALEDHFGSLEAAWRAPLSRLYDVEGINRRTLERFYAAKDAIDPDSLLDKLKRQGIEAIHLSDPDYPMGMKEYADPPAVLYKKGGLPFAEMKGCVGLVGTRRPTAYGQRHAKEYSRWLAEQGCTIVSGMAIGIDSFAHWGALEVEGLTVAVLGTGVNVCYPSSNRPLFNKLITGKNSAVISEFLPDEGPQSWHFPARNRIISGMSQVLLVFEAGLTSGSLITANIHNSYHRTILALPGRIDNASSAGSNKLISDLKATLLTSPQQVIPDVNWEDKPLKPQPPPPPIELYGREKEVYELLSDDPVHFDYIVEKTGMKSGELSAVLTMLELAGVVTRLPGDRYSRHEAFASL